MEKLIDRNKFYDLLPQIVRLHQENNDRFPTGMGDLDVASELMRVFNTDNVTYLDLYEFNNEIKFFASIEFVDEETAFWWMVYSHPRNRENTNKTMEKIKQELKDRGIKYIESLTHRTTPSYKRWMKRLNFFPFKIHYRCKL